MGFTDLPTVRSAKTLFFFLPNAFCPNATCTPIQRIADTLLDHVHACGTIDLVHAYGYPLPITVICDMLSVPHAQHVADDCPVGPLALGERLGLVTFL